MEGRRTGSWLDRLQKDAHASELHPGNTSAAAFLGFVAAQAAIACAACCCLGNVFAWAGVVALCSHWLGFAISIAIGTCKYFDITEDLALLSMFVGVFATDHEKASAMSLIHRPRGPTMWRMSTPAGMATLSPAPASPPPAALG